MAEDNEDQQPEQPDVYVASSVISSGPETGAIVSVAKIKARDLTDDHVGKFIAGYDPAVGANVPAKILKVRHVNEGKAPGYRCECGCRHCQTARLTRKSLGTCRSTTNLNSWR